MLKLFFIMILSFSVFLTGCTKDMDVNENINKVKDIAGEKVKEIINEKLDENEQIQVLKDYYTFIQNRIDEDEILNFLKKNIEGMDEFRVDEMLLDLENHLMVKGYDTKGILQKIAPFLQNASDELRSYFRIWEVEVQEQVTDGEKLNLPVYKILDRALSVEEHIEKYPDGRTKEKLKELYISYMKLSTQGLGNPYIFADEGENHIKEEILDSYKGIIRDNPNSITAKVLEEYLSELEKDNMELNGNNVYYFFDNVDRIINGLI